MHKCWDAEKPALSLVEGTANQLTLLQTEIRRLVDRIVLHMKIQKVIIYYHSMFKFLSKTKLNVRFKLLAGFRH